MRAPSLLLAATFLCAAVARAQGAGPRDEDAMFGSGDAPPSEAPVSADAGMPSAVTPPQDALPPSVPAASAPAKDLPDTTSQEAEGLSGPMTEDAFQTGLAKDDPLRIGGQFYVRAIAQGNDRSSFARSTLSLPTLVDAFLDGRPNDHLRAMVVGRLIYDPLLTQLTFPGVAATAIANPSVVLDRAWLSFDIARSVFVTVGRERIRWGTARIWNPTDFLASVRRDPLAQFDARVGVSMVKVHIPVESLGWNFYVIGVFETTQRPGGLGSGGSGSSTLPQATGSNAFGTAGVGNALRDVGGAFRGEFVFGQTEIGIDGLAQRGRNPRLGVDVSAGVGPVDLYAEAALQRGTDVTRYRRAANPDPAAGLNGLVEAVPNTDAVVGVSAGVSYQLTLNDTSSLVLTGEYFFNSGGYTSSEIYPYLIFTGAYQPFYTGRHYAAINLALPSPGTWENVTFSLTNLGNISDRSFISRIDFIIRVLSYLQVEAFVAGHYGRRGGELRLGFDTPAGIFNGQPIPAIAVPAPTFDLGVGLRMSM